jgi:threonine dehydratase
VVGVEPDTSTCMTSALAAGEAVDVAYSGYAAGTKRAGEIAFAVVSQFVERVVLVSDDAIREAQRRLWNEVRVFAEPGGAAALAALLSGAASPSRASTSSCSSAGRNGDLSAIASPVRRVPDRRRTRP